MSSRSDARSRGRRARTYWTIALVGALVAGVRGFDGLDRAAAFVDGWLTLPYATVAKAARWGLGAGLAPDPARAERARIAAEELDRREREIALAGRAGLRERGGLAAGVRARASAEATYEIDRGLRDGVKPGDPVTFGDVFAGVVASVKDVRSVVNFPWNRSVRLCLQTAQDPPRRMVASGGGDGILRIVVSSERALPPTVAVEIASTPDGSSLDAAAGFRVGVLNSGAEGFYSTIEVDPNIQGERLTQVVVRTQESFEDGPVKLDIRAWTPLTLAPTGDLSPGRAATIATSSAVFTLGAAVALDGHLVGTVARAGGPTAWVRFLEDPGYTVRVVLLPSSGAPIPLRRVRTAGGDGVSLTLEPADRWGEMPESARGILLTAGGDGVFPKGLVLGDATIVNANAPGKASIHLTRPFRGADLEDVVMTSPVGP